MTAPAHTPWIERLAATIQGDGPRCVLLGHGIGTDQTSWRLQADALLRQGWRVVGFDFAGSTPHTQEAFHPERHRSLFGFAEDLTMLARELDLRDVVYVGHSLGAMAGLLAANGTPGLFRAVVAVGCSARYLDDPATGYVGGMSLPEVEHVLDDVHGNYVAWANGFARSMVGVDGPHFGAREFALNLLGLRPDIASTVLRATLLADHRDDVRSMRTPLYLIHASADPAVPESAVHWMAGQGRARRVLRVEAQGHFPHLSAPQAFMQALQPCLEDALHA